MRTHDDRPQAVKHLVRQSLRSAAKALGTRDPLPYVDGLIDRTFYLPDDDVSYARNSLTPGAVPYEPSFSESEPNLLRFTIEPLGPEASPVARRDEATREARRLIAPIFGQDALRWFDRRSEAWRGFGGLSWMNYGAWFGSAFDQDGLYATKIYYELLPNQIDALAPALSRLTKLACDELPGLVPIFTSIGCKRDTGSQRVTFLHRGALAVNGLGPLMNRLGIGHQLPGLMRVVGVALGGRFELPAGGVLIGLRDAPDGAELKLEVLLAAIPDLPARFLDLLKLGLAERPRQLAALARWLDAFGMDDAEQQGHFSVLSIRVTPNSPARISLYVRPIEFEMREAIEDARALQ
ncbi:hypothetical protein VC273_13340 [Xanthomonas nasturtii]|uniref:hypothetical protein n=1 Tax=Xanthomonas TaxID=338 RepID=UPI0006FBDA6D|nr:MULTISPECIES: hypothetical protein [Xanthomonas]KQR13079.1 hypothetical protein ASF90_07610 [Xanthomonas sp. Leaf148]MEA9556856.1 hypothetical protein [Xanthomonas nasturtii]MEA9563764.1 hypothetical protein [Xanthomonas sp. WHRI 8932A]MEA9634908.1 hypothetical protein [Xanthomonas sp. WHRI 8812E]